MKNIFVFCLGFVVFLAATVACAHPPSNVMLSYDAQAKELTATIAHSSGSPNAHYVDRVEVFVNAELVTNEFPPAENDPVVVIDLSSLELVPGDTVSLRAFCNRAGDLEQVITVEE